MSSIWPWLAVAGAGALHGLNPATGWVFAAARGVRTGDRKQALRTLLPIAAGHSVSVALVAAAAALGMALDRSTLLMLAGTLLAGALLAAALPVRHGPRRPHESPLARQGRGPHGPGSPHSAPASRPAPSSQAALALWSCMMSTAHGAGLMLVPALIPICLSDGPARQITASGSLLLALAAVVLHTAAMLAVTALMASLPSLASKKIAQSFLNGITEYCGILAIPLIRWLRRHGYLQDQRTPLVDDRPDHAGRGHQLPDAQHAGSVGAHPAH